MILSIGDILKFVFDFAANVATNYVSEELMQKLRKDMSNVITDLVWDEYRTFKNDFPNVTQSIKKDDLQPSIKDYFGNLTADQLDDPLASEVLQEAFAFFFLQHKWRAAKRFNELEPTHRQALSDRVQNFKKVFKPRFEAAILRNNEAATGIFLNSLAQSGKNDQEIIQLLRELKENSIDLPTQLSQIIELQLLPPIHQWIELVMNRFRDWEFSYKYLTGQTSEAEAAEKEWLEILHQVLEWKEFQNIRRNLMPGIPGEIFIMNKADDLGVPAEWVCWGCSSEKCPDDTTVRLAATYLNQQKNAKHFVVSRNSLSVDRINLLENLEIRSHLTLDEFLQTTLNITNHRQAIINDYEKKPIFHNFIDLQCHHREQEKEALDLRTQFQEWLKKADTNHISLLGNFGTGKTVFCHRMQYELLKNYNAGERIPVLLTLRELKGIRLDGMISTIMNKMGLKQLDYPAFRTLNRLGKFVVLIDGFDEMATYATLGEMRENFLELAILAEGKAKVMLTSRTHYFEHAAKEDEVLSLPDFIAERPEFQVLYLNPFTRKQIETYLDRMKVLYKDKQQMLEKMDQMPRLRELMQIPVLLDMILKVFPRLMDYDEEITLASIYQETINDWLSSEKKKEHLKELSPEDARTFMEELAWQMHQDGKLAINFKELRSQAIKRFQAKVEVDYRDAFWGEIRTCTFLTRDSYGNYGFAHKSFMEYFTAAFLAPLLLKDKAPETVLNEEIRQFMHQMLVKQVDYHAPQFRFQGELPKGMKRKEGDPFAFIHEKDNSEMVWIPPGQFIAGGEVYDQEKPIKIWRLEKGGFLDKFLVTNQQYARFLNEIGRFKNEWIDLSGSYKNEKSRILQKHGEFTVELGYEQHPVNFVSHSGAEAYAEWAGKELPSEWLWEKAGRGIDGRTYPWGDDWDWGKCNSGERWAKRDLVNYEVWNKWDDSDERLKAKITPVDAFVEYASPFYCADLSGNLWEWMREMWKDEKEQRVVRGGCFFNNHHNVRLAYRGYDRIPYRLTNVGFRLSRTS